MMSQKLNLWNYAICGQEIVVQSLEPSHRNLSNFAPVLNRRKIRRVCIEKLKPEVPLFIDRNNQKQSLNSIFIFAHWLIAHDLKLNKTTLTFVLRIVVLLKSVSIGKGMGDKWQQRIPQDAVDIEFFLHDPGEEKDSGWPALGNPGPHMNFVRVLDGGLEFGWHAYFTKTHFTVALQPNARLVSENNVIEGFFGLQAPFTKRQTINTVCLTHGLAIFWPSLSPTKIPANFFDGGQGRYNAAFPVKQLLKTCEYIKWKMCNCKFVYILNQTKVAMKERFMLCSFTYRRMLAHR